MKVDRLFQRIRRSSYTVQCKWDAVRQGCYIMVTRNAVGSSVHLWYDDRTKGFFPWRFPIDHGPVSSLVFDGDAPDNYVFLLGGRDGNVRKLDDASLDDDGEAIVSYFYIGPFEPAGPLQATIVRSLTSILGENYSSINGAFTSVNSDWNLQMSIWSANTPWRALDDPTQKKDFTAHTTSGEQNSQGCSIGDTAFWLRGFNATLGKTWITEKFVMTVVPGGRQDGIVDA
jgi:hypothetical protein